MTKELQKLKALKKAVETFLTFQAPAAKPTEGKAKAKPKAEAKAEAKAKVEPKAKEVKEPKKRVEQPGYQVKVDFGWARYDEAAQKVLQEAAAKGREECGVAI